MKEKTGRKAWVVIPERVEKVASGNLLCNRTSVYLVLMKDKHSLGKNTLMMKFLLWLILAVLCWPLALLALVLYPFVWLVMLPFRLVGITVNAFLTFIKALFLFPSRILKGPAAR